MKKFISIWLVMLTVIAGLWLYGSNTGGTIFHEGGIIETLSAVGYFAAFLLLCLYAVRKRNHVWALCVMLFAFGLRELDCDKRFTEMGIFKSRFYSSSEVPVVQKIVAAMVSLVLIYSIFIIIKHYARPFFRQLKERDPLALNVFFGLGLMGFAKSIDGLSRKLKGLGIEISSAVSSSAEILEESLEMIIPMLFIMTASCYLRAEYSNNGDTLDSSAQIPNVPEETEI